MSKPMTPNTDSRELDDILDPLWWSDETHLDEAKQAILKLIQEAYQQGKNEQESLR